uniref:Uncharacterized protein n=1 Tax=uncultured marine microorganism HF4000_ANIW137G21 TaxID=455530 RepID=B3T4I2_9ZZZZ|nr:hypothetical protein ALOHA_HF4000ANIW137G21ctg1g20 [uncultured marine microorganism HF4000_ANIW137G21]
MPSDGVWTQYDSDGDSVSSSNVFCHCQSFCVNLLVTGSVGREVRIETGFVNQHQPRATATSEFVDRGEESIAAVEVDVLVGDWSMPESVDQQVAHANAPSSSSWAAQCRMAISATLFEDNPNTTPWPLLKTRMFALCRFASIRRQPTRSSRLTSAKRLAARSSMTARPKEKLISMSPASERSPSSDMPRLSSSSSIAKRATSWRAIP